MEKKRLDVILWERGLATSRTHAQELIEAGQVFIIDQGQRKALKKSSQAFVADTEFHVESGPANRYVSRGGLKLEGALRHLDLSVEGFNVLDVGISTGGFSDCLFKNGAQFVLGVDVGHGQVSPSLQNHSGLKILEGVNARNLSKNAEVLQSTPQGKFDLIVMDVSFISIELIIPELRGFLKPSGHLLSLVKPQFEVGADGLSKGGIVKDASLYGQVERNIKNRCQKDGFKVIDYFASSIEGKDGNHEFFIYAQAN